MATPSASGSDDPSGYRSDLPAAQPAGSGVHRLFARSQISRYSVPGPFFTAHRTPGALVPDAWYIRPLRFAPNTLASSAVVTDAPPGQGSPAMLLKQMFGVPLLDASV